MNLEELQEAWPHILQDIGQKVGQQAAQALEGSRPVLLESDSVTVMLRGEDAAAEFVFNDWPDLVKYVVSPYLPSNRRGYQVYVKWEDPGENYD